MLFLFTAFAVSIDAYLVGVGLRRGAKECYKAALSVFVCVFIVSFAAFCLGSSVNIAGKWFSFVGAAVFFVLGSVKFFEKEERETFLLPPKRVSSGWRYWALGVGVSVDCVPPCALFAVSVIEAAVYSAILASMHLIFLLCGSIGFSAIGKSAVVDKISGLMLMTVGILKLAVI